MRDSGVLGSMGIKWWRLEYKDTQLFFAKTTCQDGFVAKVAPQRISRHSGNLKEQVFLHLTDADSPLQGHFHCCLEYHPPQPIVIPYLKVPNWSFCWLDVHIHTDLFPGLNVVLLIHLCRIASRIQILMQIWWLMKEQPLVGTLPAMW